MFQLFLELEPQLREVIQCFYDSKSGQCLKLLDEFVTKEKLYKLDIELIKGFYNKSKVKTNKALIPELEKSFDVA